IRRKTDRCQKTLKVLHLIGSQSADSALKIGKSAIKLFDAIPVPAPVEWLVSNNILQGEGNHRAFHRVKMIGGRGRKVSEIKTRIDKFHVARRLAQVPSEPVES